MMHWKFSEEPFHGPPKTGVYLAATEDDLGDVDALWREVYGREYGWLHSDAPALHKDHFHESSVYLLATEEGRGIGTMRLVRDSPQQLPVEQFTTIESIRQQNRRLVECQRLMVLTEYRNKRLPGMPYGVFGALVKGCLHWCLRNAYSHIVADLFRNTATTPMDALLAIGFEDSGIEFVDTELDEPDRSVALTLEVGELFSRPFRCDSKFYRYLMEPDSAISVYK